MSLERRISNLERNDAGAGMVDGDPVKFYVNNRTGSTLTKGQVVYISGASGNKVTVALARANAEATSAKTFGVLENDIANNQSGWVVTAGEIIKLDTSAYADGATLYLSGTTAGGWATTKPAAPTHLVYVGFVSRSHATVGSIFVRCQNGYELDEIHDVQIVSPANADRLTYESSSGLWKNVPVTRIDLSNTGSTQSGTSGTTITVGASGTAANQWTVNENLGSTFTLGTTTGVVTVSKAGRYAIYGRIRYTAAAGGTRRALFLTLNGSTDIGANSTAPQGAANAVNLSVGVPSFRLSANDTLELRVTQDSGGSLALAPTSTAPQYFIIEYLGA